MSFQTPKKGKKGNKKKEKSPHTPPQSQDDIQDDFDSVSSDLPKDRENPRSLNINRRLFQTPNNSGKKKKKWSVRKDGDWVVVDSPAKVLNKKSEKALNQEFDQKEKEIKRRARIFFDRDAMLGYEVVWEGFQDTNLNEVVLLAREMHKKTMCFLLKAREYQRNLGVSCNETVKNDLLKQIKQIMEPAFGASDECSPRRKENYKKLLREIQYIFCKKHKFKQSIKGIEKRYFFDITKDLWLQDLRKLAENNFNSAFVKIKLAVKACLENKKIDAAMDFLYMCYYFLPELHRCKIRIELARLCMLRSEGWYFTKGIRYLTEVAQEVACFFKEHSDLIEQFFAKGADIDELIKENKNIGLALSILDDILEYSILLSLFLGKSRSFEKLLDALQNNPLFKLFDEMINPRLGVLTNDISNKLKYKKYCWLLSGLDSKFSLPDFLGVAEICTKLLPRMMVFQVDKDNSLNLFTHKNFSNAPRLIVMFADAIDGMLDKGFDLFFENPLYTQNDVKVDFEKENKYIYDRILVSPYAEKLVNLFRTMLIYRQYCDEKVKLPELKTRLEGIKNKFQKVIDGFIDKCDREIKSSISKASKDVFDILSRQKVSGSDEIHRLLVSFLNGIGGILIAGNDLITNRLLVSHYVGAWHDFRNLLHTHAYRKINKLIKKWAENGVEPVKVIEEMLYREIKECVLNVKKIYHRPTTFLSLLAMEFYLECDGDPKKMRQEILLWGDQKLAPKRRESLSQKLKLTGILQRSKLRKILFGDDGEFEKIDTSKYIKEICLTLLLPYLDRREWLYYKVFKNFSRILRQNGFIPGLDKIFPLIDIISISFLNRILGGVSLGPGLRPYFKNSNKTALHIWNKQLEKFNNDELQSIIIAEKTLRHTRKGAVFLDNLCYAFEKLCNRAPLTLEANNPFRYLLSPAMIARSNHSGDFIVATVNSYLLQSFNAGMRLYDDNNYDLRLVIDKDKTDKYQAKNDKFYRAVQCSIHKHASGGWGELIKYLEKIGYNGTAHALKKLKKLCDVEISNKTTKVDIVALYVAIVWHAAHQLSQLLTQLLKKPQESLGSKKESSQLEIIINVIKAISKFIKKIFKEDLQLCLCQPIFLAKLLSDELELSRNVGKYSLVAFTTKKAARKSIDMKKHLGELQKHGENKVELKSGLGSDILNMCFAVASDDYNQVATMIQDWFLMGLVKIAAKETRSFFLKSAQIFIDEGKYGDLGKYFFAGIPIIKKLNDLIVFMKGFGGVFFTNNDLLDKHKIECENQLNQYIGQAREIEKSLLNDDKESITNCRMELQVAKIMQYLIRKKVFWEMFLELVAAMRPSYKSENREIEPNLKSDHLLCLVYIAPYFLKCLTNKDEKEKFYNAMCKKIELVCASDDFLRGQLKFLVDKQECATEDISCFDKIDHSAIKSNNKFLSLLVYGKIFKLYFGCNWQLRDQSLLKLHNLFNKLSISLGLPSIGYIEEKPLTYNKLFLLERIIVEFKNRIVLTKGIKDPEKNWCYKLIFEDIESYCMELKWQLVTQLNSKLLSKCYANCVLFYEELIGDDDKKKVELKLKESLGEKDKKLLLSCLQGKNGKSVLLFHLASSAPKCIFSLLFGEKISSKKIAFGKDDNSLFQENFIPALQEMLLERILQNKADDNKEAWLQFGHIVKFQVESCILEISKNGGFNSKKLLKIRARKCFCELLSQELQEGNFSYELKKAVFEMFNNQLDNIANQLRFIMGSKGNINDYAIKQILFKSIFRFMQWLSDKEKKVGSKVEQKCLYYLALEKIDLRYKEQLFQLYEKQKRSNLKIKNKQSAGKMDFNGFCGVDIIRVYSGTKEKDLRFLLMKQLNGKVNNQCYRYLRNKVTQKIKKVRKGRMTLNLEGIEKIAKKMQPVFKKVCSKGNKNFSLELLYHQALFIACLCELYCCKKLGNNLPIIFKSLNRYLEKNADVETIFSTINSPIKMINKYIEFFDMGLMLEYIQLSGDSEQQKIGYCIEMLVHRCEKMYFLKQNQVFYNKQSKFFKLKPIFIHAVNQNNNQRILLKYYLTGNEMQNKCGYNTLNVTKKEFFKAIFNYLCALKSKKSNIDKSPFALILQAARNNPRLLQGGFVFTGENELDVCGKHMKMLETKDRIDWQSMLAFKMIKKENICIWGKVDGYFGILGKSYIVNQKKMVHNVVFNDGHFWRAEISDSKVFSQIVDQSRLSKRLSLSSTK